MVKAIVVFGYGIYKDGSISEITKRSIELAKELFDTGDYEIILLSGRWSYNIKYVPKFTESEAMELYANKIGIDKKYIILENKSYDTIGNVIFTSRILNDIKNLSLINVVTLKLRISKIKYLLKLTLNKKVKIKFSKVKMSELDKKRLDELKILEENSFRFLKHMYKEIPDQKLPFQEISMKIHPVYSKNIDLIPEEIRKEYERRGYNSNKLKKIESIYRNKKSKFNNID
ncbi:MAG: YdcF family protein [Candidatus Micrarchaeia archaeon]